MHMHTQPSYEPVPCNAGPVSETVFLFAAKHTATTVASCSAWGARRGRRSQCRRRWRPPRRTQRRLRGGPRPARPRSAPRAARAGQQPRRLLPRQVQVDASDSTDHRDALAPCCVTWLCRRSCTAAFLCYSAPCRLSLPGCAGRRASTEKLLQGGSGAPSMDTARRATPAGAALRNCSEQTMTAAPPSARRAHSSCVVAGATGADAATSCQVGTLAARQHACRCLRMRLLPVEGSWSARGGGCSLWRQTPACTRNTTAAQCHAGPTPLATLTLMLPHCPTTECTAAGTRRACGPAGAGCVQRHQAGAHRELAPRQAPGQAVLRDAGVAVRQRGRGQRAGRRGAPAAAAARARVAAKGRLAAAHGGVRARQELGRRLRAHGVARRQRDQVAPCARRDAACLTWI